MNNNFMNNSLSQSEDQQSRGNISPLVAASKVKQPSKHHKQKQLSHAGFGSNTTQYLSSYTSTKSNYHSPSLNVYIKNPTSSQSSTQQTQKIVGQNSGLETNLIKKMDGRTNSQHQLPYNSQNSINSYIQSNSLFIQQNIDSAKSTSPQIRSINGNTNPPQGSFYSQANQTISSLQLLQTKNKILTAQLNTSTNTFNSPSNSVLSSSNAKQLQNFQLNKNYPSQFNQHNVMSSNYMNSQQPYLSNNTQSQNSFSIQKPKSANQTNQGLQQYQLVNSDQKKKSVDVTDKVHFNNNYFSNIANSTAAQLNNANKQILEDNSNFIKSKHNSLLQYINSDSSSISKQQQQQQQQLLTNSNDIYQNEMLFEKNQPNLNDKNQLYNSNLYNININNIENPATSSNATEDEVVKLTSLDSGSIKSQTQQNNKNVNNINQQQYYLNFEKEIKINSLENENTVLKEKIKSLEQQIQAEKDNNEQKIQLLVQQTKDQCNLQYEQNLNKLKEENNQREIKEKKELDSKMNQQQAHQDQVLKLLNALMSQKNDLVTQMKQIQDKLGDNEFKLEEKNHNIESKHEHSPSSIDNLIQRTSNSQNNIFNNQKMINPSSLSQTYAMSNYQDSVNNQFIKMDAEIINEEDDCSTGTHQETVKSIQKRNNYINRKGGSKSTTNEDLSNSIGFQSSDKGNATEKCFNDEYISNSQSPLSKKKSLRNSSLLISPDTRIEELQRLIGTKNHEIQTLKEKLYAIKDFLLQSVAKSEKLSIPTGLIDFDNQPMKRRKSVSSASDLHSLATLSNTRKPIQNTIMEWSYYLDCSGSVEKLIDEGWKLQQLDSKANLGELGQVIGVLGMPKTGKTTIINGIMKGSLQTVEEKKISSFFDPKLNIILDENIAIFEYSYMQPIQIDNQQQISQSSIADLTHQKCFSTIIEEQVQKTNRRDFFWIDFFIKNTKILMIVFDKFTQEEQKMLSEVLYRIENEESLVVKEVILIHNYYSKGLTSAQELQSYFSQSLQHIHSNFIQKPLLELKNYSTVIPQKITQSKKCYSITHILNGNLFEPFAEKYQHNMLQLCMNKLSAINQSQVNQKFLPQFENFLKNNLIYYYNQTNNINSLQAIQENQNIFKNGYLDFDEYQKSLVFRYK